MKIIIGFFIVTIGFIISLSHLNQNITQYWDLIAFSIVIGGTIASAIMTMPSLHIKYLKKIFLRGISNRYGLKEDCINNSIQLLKGNIPDASAKRIDQKIIVDGMKLIRLGFTTQKINDVLIDRIEKYTNDSLTVAYWIRSLSKYPPAFGLAGTVFGLVHLMRGLSEGAGPKETGIRMAVALIATFYGIIASNIFINPIGDRILSNTRDDQSLSEISLKAVLLISEKVNYVEALEHMNNYLPEQNKKINFDHGFLESV